MIAEVAVAFVTAFSVSVDFFAVEVVYFFEVEDLVLPDVLSGRLALPNVKVCPSFVIVVGPLGIGIVLLPTTIPEGPMMTDEPLDFVIVFFDDDGIAIVDPPMMTPKLVLDFFELPPEV